MAISFEMITSKPYIVQIPVASLAAVLMISGSGTIYTNYGFYSDPFVLPTTWPDRI